MGIEKDFLWPGWDRGGGTVTNFGHIQASPLSTWGHLTLQGLSKKVNQTQLSLRSGR